MSDHKTALEVSVWSKCAPEDFPSFTAMVGACVRDTKVHGPADLHRVETDDYGRFDVMVSYDTGSWRDIESAPKDGTTILGWEYGDVIYTCRWSPPCNPGQEGYWDLLEAGSFAGDGVVTPKKWRRAPAPPTLPPTENQA